MTTEEADGALYYFENGELVGIEPLPAYI